MILNIEEKIQNLQIETRPFINGVYCKSIDGRSIPKKSSIDGRELPSLEACNEKDIDFAVKIALETYKNKIWADLEPKEKKRVILKLADLVEDNIEELALLDTIETGRSLKNYYYDSIPKAIEVMRWFAEASDKFFDHAIPPRKNSFATITREPLGVVGLITPWNDPLVVAFWKIVPALLMGNSVVLKPAEQSSYSILKVAQLAIDAGLPKGVLNIVTGYGNEAGKALALHNDVRGIFFTGSTFVGKQILQYAGQSNMKKVGLECGGKSPFIISEKCNQLEEAAKVLTKNIFYNQGQICSAPSRLIINKKIKNKFLEILLKESEKYIPKNPLSLENEVGAIVSESQKNRVEEYIKTGIESGARIITSKEELKIHNGGSYVNPTIFDDVDPNSKIAQEEIFGPVLVVIGVDTVTEAIEVANNSKYGLAASIWTNDFDEAYQVSRLLEAGIVHINSYGDDDNMVPFGGIKESGLGKDKSVYAFDEYSEIKTIWMNFKNI
ncbi:aldehyde dehydrogenase family protein [Arcobacter lacus]|uniref:aldehyde dehydrogenase family protein n=1 Tax=Arcobacter lacus TaxID=1912876 RepID=UPI0021BBA7ED|nr:aldehyde dehydrogenase family protein [Arcobacter lacus]MCT7909647.1 aldehyde dehydrogenase family protein [Arcobacter lacus]